MKAILVLLLIAYQIQLFAQEVLKPTEDLALLDVFVSDMEDVARPQDKIIFEGKFTKKIIEGISNNQGKFQVLLPEGDIYLIKIQGLTNQTSYDEVKIPKQEGKMIGGLAVRYRPARQYNLDDVHFETNKSVLLPSSFPTLDNLAEVLQYKTAMRVEIAGHTDNIGADESNLKLSQNRAQAVVEYLVKKGIDASRLVAQGYGATQPIASNETEEGRQENRRTEARILGDVK